MMTFVILVAVIAFASGSGDLFGGVTCNGEGEVLITAEVDPILEVESCCAIVPSNWFGTENTISCSNESSWFHGKTCYRNDWFKSLKRMREHCVQNLVDEMYDMSYGDEGVQQYSCKGVEDKPWCPETGGLRGGAGFYNTKMVNPNFVGTCCATVLNCDNLPNTGAGCTGGGQSVPIFQFVAPPGLIYDENGAQVTGAP